MTPDIVRSQTHKADKAIDKAIVALLPIKDNPQANIILGLLETAKKTIVFNETTPETPTETTEEPPKPEPTVAKTKCIHCGKTFGYDTTKFKLATANCAYCGRNQYQPGTPKEEPKPLHYHKDQDMGI